MKAAVLHKVGDSPKYEDFPDPTSAQDESLIQVLAVPLENVDKAMAAGTHFASHQFLSSLPAIVGFDGIGRLEDGSLVGFGGTRAPYGAMAERTVVPKTHTVAIPHGIDAITAAAMPASALTSLFPLKWAANLLPAETVLVNGATGVSGRLAVQIARLLGAGRVVGTGRNPQSMKKVLELGADSVIDLMLPDAEVVKAFEQEAGEGYDVILDFLWGHPTELLIQTLVPKGLHFARGRVRLVQIGEKAGATISLPADSLRTSGLEILGGAAGVTPEAIGEGTQLVYDWIRAGRLQMEIEQVALKDIEKVWERSDFQGRRIVVLP
ncbi:MAG TPA: zinc-binding alcohol dehydrogenase family protein [Anaerolineales bacterium]|nr:zinc-binding alcohol dehydrogenase family protein [Anaerolineales bacterium]